MSIGERIISTMNAKGYSKNYLAKSIGIHPTTLNNWILGKTSPDNLKLDVLCDFLGINTDWLITGEGDMIKSPSNGTPINDVKIKMIPLVSQYAQAGYLCGFGDMQYIGALPTIPTVVDHEPHGNYIAFEVKGDSMYDGTDESLNEGDILVCREVDKIYWNNKLHINKWDFVVVHKEEGVLVKRIVDHDVSTGLIKLHSLNSFYPDFTLHLKDISQLFNVVQIVRSRRR